jgi:hypothetical protein
MSFFEREVKMWHQRYNNEAVSRIPPKTVIDVLGQCDENVCPNIFVLQRNIRDSTDKEEHEGEIVVCIAVNKNRVAKRNETRLTEWTDPSQYPHGN